MGLEPNWPVFPVQTRTAGGLPWPVANTRIELLAYQKREFAPQLNSFYYCGITAITITLQLHSLENLRHGV